MGDYRKTSVPCIPNKLLPSEIDKEELRKRDGTYKEKMSYYFDRRNGLRNTQSFTRGETVRVGNDNEKSWSTTGTVTQQVAPRSYIVSTDQGSYRRNAKHVMLDKGIEKPCSSIVDNETSEARDSNVPSAYVNLSTNVGRSEQPNHSTGYVTKTRSGRLVKPVNKLTL